MSFFANWIVSSVEEKPSHSERCCTEIDRKAGDAACSLIDLRSVDEKLGMPLMLPAKVVSFERAGIYLRITSEHCNNGYLSLPFARLA